MAGLPSTSPLLLVLRKEHGATWIWNEIRKLKKGPQIKCNVYGDVSFFKVNLRVSSEKST